MRISRICLIALAALAAAPSVAAAAGGSCERQQRLRPGPADGGIYETVAPFEHYGYDRTQLFPATCTLGQLTGGGTPRIVAREAPGDYSTPYIAATRDRGELYVYGYGASAADEGGYIAKVDPDSLAEEWRTRIPDPDPPGAWSYPGVAAVHGNGYLYAVYASVLVKVDPESGRVLARRDLPEDPDCTGAAYNGLVVLPDGRIVVKKIERGPCSIPPGASASAGAIGGLSCAAANALPSRVVVVDPGRLRILSSVVPPEPVTGRITWGHSGGHDYVYAAGTDDLFRYRYDDGRLRLDHGWGPVRYRTGEQRAGTGPGILGRFVVVQTNFIRSSEPMTVTAVSVADSDRVFRTQPFADSGTASWIVSKAALDADNGLVITHDTAAGRMAALRLDPRKGFSVAWRRDLSALAFSALVGGRGHRQIVVPDFSGGSDRVVWLDERTGRELARSDPLASAPAPGNIVTPGFGGRFFYLSAEGRLWRLRPR